MVAVLVAVHGYLVSAAEDLLKLPWGSSHLFTDYKERGPRIILFQQSQERVQTDIRPVVEG